MSVTSISVKQMNYTNLSCLYRLSEKCAWNECTYSPGPPLCLHACVLQMVMWITKIHCSEMNIGNLVNHNFYILLLHI